MCFGPLWRKETLLCSQVSLVYDLQHLWTDFTGDYWAVSLKDKAMFNAQVFSEIQKTLSSLGGIHLDIVPTHGV